MGVAISCANGERGNCHSILSFALGVLRPVLVVSLLAPPPPTPPIEVEPIVKEEMAPSEGRTKSRAQGSSGTKRCQTVDTCDSYFVLCIKEYL